MHRTIRLVALAALALLIASAVTACGGGGAASPSPVSVTLTATEFAFDPKTVNLPANTTATIVIKNAGTIEHDFTIDTPAVKIAAKVGATAEGQVGPLTAGTYDFYCSIPGHKEAGMVGTLEVK